MDIDRQRVEERLAYIRGETTALRALLQSQTDVSVLLQDPWKRRGVRYALQTAIEAIADVAYHICAKGFHYAPPDPHEALDRLGQEGVLTTELLSRLHGMVGLRNRLVHGYMDVDDARVLALLNGGLGDFDSYVAQIKEFLSRFPGAGAPPVAQPQT
ncbi:MAG: DUF86 domain-containing protein [Bacillota bacterium]